MANTETSYRCARCGVSSDNKEQAIIHATGPLHAGVSFTVLYPNSPEAQREMTAEKATLSIKEKR